MSRIAQVQLFLFVLTLGFLTGPRVIQAIQGLDTKDAEVSIVRAPLPSPATEQIASPEKSVPSPYEKMSLRAKSAYVWDVHERKKLFSQNSDEQLPLASVAKMMTALVATQSLAGETVVTIESADLLEEGDTGLLSGEKWSLEKLIQFTLIASSNDGASAIAAAVGKSLGHATTTRAEGKKLFIEKMNQRALAIGLTQTTFNNESGLDADVNQGGAYGSARDMAMLFDYVFRRHPALFAATAHGEIEIRSESGFVHHASNTNQDVEHMTGIIGSKTGFTNLAGGNLVVVVDVGINHPVVIAVLGSTREERFTDVEQLFSQTKAVVSGTTP